MSCISSPPSIPRCIGIRAKTAGASPRGAVTAITEASNCEVFLGTLNKIAGILIVKIKIESDNPKRRMGVFPKLRDIPIKIKKNIFIKKTISEKKDNSLVERG